jgi:hypothetical protein
MLASVEPTPPLMEPVTGIPAPTTSLFTRMFNVFAAPADVFDEVKVSPPSTANWLVPVLLCIVVGVLSIFVIYSQPSVIQKIHDKQTQTFERQVQDGKMTRAQADQTEAAVEKFGGPTMLKFSGSVIVVIFVFVRLFWLALLIWLMGKWFLQADFPYQQALEVVGLAGVIGILGSIVMSLLSIAMGDMTPLNLALLAPNADPTSLSHLVLSMFDLFDLWMFGVVAVGLARLAGVSFSRALVPVMIYWVIMDTLLVTVSWGASHLQSLMK